LTGVWGLIYPASLLKRLVIPIAFIKKYRARQNERPAVAQKSIKQISRDEKQLFALVINLLTRSEY